MFRILDKHNLTFRVLIIRDNGAQIRQMNFSLIRIFSLIVIVIAVGIFFTKLNYDYQLYKRNYEITEQLREEIKVLDSTIVTLKERNNSLVQELNELNNELDIIDSYIQVMNEEEVQFNLVEAE